MTVRYHSCRDAHSEAAVDFLPPDDDCRSPSRSQRLTRSSHSAGSDSRTPACTAGRGASSLKSAAAAAPASCKPEVLSAQDQLQPLLDALPIRTAVPWHSAQLNLCMNTHAPS